MEHIMFLVPFSFIQLLIDRKILFHFRSFHDLQEKA